MPGVLPGGDDWWAHQQAQLFNVVRGLLTQQQDTITNEQGQPVINFGLIPGSSPARYGLQFVNPATGAEVMFIGVDDAGVPGVHIYDTAGNEEVRLGELNTSPAIYGLAVLNPASTLQMVDGVVVSGTGNLSTTATTPQAITGTSVSATIGPSGQALVTLAGSGEMNGPAGAGGSAYFAVGIDGVAPGSSAFWAQLQTNLAGTQLTAPVAVSRVVNGLSAGSHSFQAYVWSDSATHSALLDGAYTIVQAL